MRKPQITRIESPLRQARTRAARRCSEHVNEFPIDTRQIRFNDKSEKDNRRGHERLSGDSELAS
jgi:hypothetical protein